jgi:hypothetical protein
MSSPPEYRTLKAPSDTVVLAKPGKIRWASGKPDGPRSSTWEVVGAANTDDVYLGSRPMMGAMKLSLHKSDVWRLAFTKPIAKKYLPPGADSLIARYSPTTPLAPGWHCAARIMTPSTTFGPAYKESRPRDRGPILFVESPPHEHVHVEYHVLLGDSNAPVATMQRSKTVGRMTLTSGKQILIAATLWEMTEKLRRFIASAQALGPGPAGARGIAAGDGDGVPFFVDIGDWRAPA